MTAKKPATPKPKRINQGDVLRRFGEEVCTFSVGESAMYPGSVQITQYSSRIAGPFSATEARALAAALNAAANAVSRVCPVCQDGACETKSIQCGKGGWEPGDRDEAPLSAREQAALDLVDRDEDHRKRAEDE